MRDIKDKSTADKDPYQSNAPWPTMRGDTKNSGRLKDLKWENPGIKPKTIHFRTKNAIFSTPIIDAEECVFVGSADHKFYSFDPHEGVELWHKDVGEVIDSAGCVDKDGTVYVAAGDGKVHAYAPDGEEKWTFNVLKNRVKKQFTFSTNYWFEANIVLGPDGGIYVANDDFFLYKLSKDGKPIWGFRTGFLIWSAPSFGKDGTVYIAGFDHILYALDNRTGRLKWKINLRGSLVSSPAIGEGGIIYQGSFSGKLHALDGKNGKVKWEINTGGHIYASPAIGLDNVVYFGSTNGTFYAVEGETGKIKWTYYIGDAIRASASIGPDPEDKTPYLIYLGGGDGLVYAFDPNGRLRWSYNTLQKALNTDYPNINASIALGHNGLAVASSTGDVIWITYDYYLEKDAPGITLGQDVKKEKGALWHYVTPGGKLQVKPLKQDELMINPTSIITLRLLLHQTTSLAPAILEPASIKSDAQPKFRHRIEVQSDNNTINIIPISIIKPDTEYKFTITASFTDDGGQRASIESTLNFKTKKTPHAASIISHGNNTFKIIHMAVPQPRIIPSLDQIGLASLTIPFSIIESDPERKTFIAWAVQKFGEEGVPQKRVSLYAFSGRIQDDYFVMKSSNCLFEITSFTIPLDLFSLSGLLKPDGTAAGGSMLIEKSLEGSMLSMLGEFTSGSSTFTLESIINYLKLGGVMEFFKAAFTFIPSLLRQFSMRTFEDWGLMNYKKKILGVGTFKMESIPSEKESVTAGIEIFNFEVKPSKRRVIAELKVPEKSSEWETVVSILLVDKIRGKVIPINYNSAISRKELKNERKRVVLSIPKSVQIKLGNMRAHLMVEIYPVKQIDF